MRDLSADARLQHLSLNTATVRKQGDFLQIIEAAKRHGISCLSPWRDQVQAVGLERAVKIALEAWSVGHLALGDAAVKELPPPEKISTARREQMRAAGVEAAILERDSKIAIRYRPLSEEEVRAAMRD